MTIIQKIGIGLFVLALGIFTLVPGLNSYNLTESAINISNEYHAAAFAKAAQNQELYATDYGSTFALQDALKNVFAEAKTDLDQQAAAGIPDGVAEWDFKLGDWKFKEYFKPELYRDSSTGMVADNPWLFIFLTIGLGLIGGLMYILPKFSEHEGIKNNHIYHNSLTRGLTFSWRAIALAVTVGGVLVYGISYMDDRLFWPGMTALVMGLITALVFFATKSIKQQPPRSASPSFTGWLGILTGIYLISFYVFLYWAPAHIAGWMVMTTPISEMLNGGAASRWFVYGLLYTIIILVMGVRMISKYRHNKYQMIRTGSVMFFQTSFAFLIPEILSLLNQPSMDLKNIWPLNYTFFFDWNINNLLNSGGLGIFMLVWGIVLVVIAVPVITYFFGKRWYCSWVCGCGGLAETLGDPYRQLSDKSLQAWKYERYIIHGVLAFAVIMTGMTLFTYFSGTSQIGFLHTNDVQKWYGFFIGAGFSGVVGTGFYPLMGNRVWCRFGCPLAGYLGLVQRFKSRFRITTNGGQCISCGNCSTYCEMGIDVRAYAQRGQDIVRSSCVGCGICSAVCPRGVLRLENGDSDVNTRAQEARAIHISEDMIGIL
ncbi:MAG: 4Fe-4S binding protein [Saprospiraceae bacterium]